MSNRIVQFFDELDIFGHPIGVNFKGKAMYRTRLGSLCTLVTYVFMIGNVLALTQNFFDNSRQEEKVQVLFEDNLITEAYSL